MRNVSAKICKEDENKHFVLTFCFEKSCHLCENVEKYCRAEQATDDNTAHAHRILDTQGYKNTHSFCVIFFSWRDGPPVGLGLLLIHEDFCGF